MILSIQNHWLPKHGNSLEEYEDAFFPGSSGEVEAWYFRVAVADGATETSFAGAWARELAEGYSKRRIDCHRLAQTLPRIQRRWRSGLSSQSLPWYAEEKLRLGAFSSLLGVTILDGTNGNTGSWQAVALGDTCLFQVRDNHLLTGWPIDDAESFSSRPQLISSLPSRNQSTREAVQYRTGTWQTGDRLLLLTDALAQWFVRSASQGGRPWRELTQGRGQPTKFENLIARLRRRKAIRNDDVTALVIDLL